MATFGATGVDEDCTVLLRHESGALSTLRASLRARGTSDLSVHGTHGTIHLEAPIYRPHVARIERFQPSRGRSEDGGRFEALRNADLVQGLKQRIDRWIPRGGFGGSETGSVERVARHFRGNGFHYEIEAVMRAVAAGALESDVMSLAESLEIMTLVDRARAAWQKGPAT